MILQCIMKKASKKPGKTLCAGPVARDPEVDPFNWTARDVKLIEGYCSIPRCVMAGTKKRHPAAFKAKVALEAAKQTRTAAELAKAFQVHPVQISQWKKHLLDNIESLFRDGRRREREEGQARQAELYEQIGRLNMEIEWLKKRVARCG
jgi:transposase